MNPKHKAILFYVNLVLITLVNLVLIYALYSHFILRQQQDQIQWLLVGFSAEILGCFVLGWSKTVNSSAETDEIEPKPVKRENKVINPEDPLVIEAKEIMENNDHSDTLKEGRILLEQARNKEFSRTQREKYAKQAIKVFAQIPPGSVNYFAAQYNMATAFRVLHTYSKSIRGFEKLLDFLAANKSKYSCSELRVLRSETTMMIGTVYLEKNTLNTARTYFLSSWKIDPDNMIAVLNLFEVAAKTKKVEEAKIWKEILTGFERYSKISEVVERTMSHLQKSTSQKSPAGNIALKK